MRPFQQGEIYLEVGLEGDSAAGHDCVDDGRGNTLELADVVNLNRDLRSKTPIAKLVQPTPTPNPSQEGIDVRARLRFTTGEFQESLRLNPTPGTRPLATRHPQPPTYLILTATNP